MKKTLLTDLMCISPLEQFNTSGFFTGQRVVEEEMDFLAFSFNQIGSNPHLWFIDLYELDIFFSWQQYGMGIAFAYFIYWICILVEKSVAAKNINIKFFSATTVNSWIFAQILLYFSNMGKYHSYITAHMPKEYYPTVIEADIFMTYSGDYFFSDSTCFFIICGLLIFAVASLFIHDDKGPYILSNNPFKYLFSKIHTFTVDLLSSANEKEEAAQSYYSLVYILFVYLMVCNLQGLLPFTFTVTSHIINTFFLALTVILYVTYTIIDKQGFKYLLALFMPSGTPMVLGYLLIPIEILSFLFKVVSLSVRLFANIMAGHTLLKVILGFAWTILSVSEVYYFINIFPVTVLLLLTILEIAVSVIQAYVFSILICLYLRDAFSGH